MTFANFLLSHLTNLLQNKHNLTDKGNAKSTELYSLVNELLETSERLIFMQRVVKFHRVEINLFGADRYCIKIGTGITTHR